MHFPDIKWWESNNNRRIFFKSHCRFRTAYSMPSAVLCRGKVKTQERQQELKMPPQRSLQFNDYPCRCAFGSHKPTFGFDSKSDFKFWQVFTPLEFRGILARFDDRTVELVWNKNLLLFGIWALFATVRTPQDLLHCPAVFGHFSPSP